MLDNKLQAIVLAAGKSRRFNTGTSKLNQKICGREMILFTTKLLEKLNIHTTLVVGYQKELIKDIVTKNHKTDIQFVHQEEQKGTGHAILCARNSWSEENILIINGDMPLITKEIIEQLYSEHIEKKAMISFVYSHNIDPNNSYGRVVKTENSIQIIEAKDFDGSKQDHCCINAGIYIVNKKFLEQHIKELESSNASQEFYFTDLIKIASDNKYTVAMLSAPFDRIRGINTLEELWAAEQIKRSDLIKYWMQQGVRFFAPQNVHIDIDVTIGAQTKIGSGAHILKGTHIGKNCQIYQFTTLKNSTIEDNTTIYSHSIIKDSIIHESAEVGPFAHLRNGAIIKKEAVVGNFVEIKNSTVGEKTKAKHLSYLGDATIGKGTNIGAGTITCNHNGLTKEKTTIKDGAYIGSNNTLVAPVTIEKNAYTAAGSTITNNVPENSLAFGRAKQVTKKDYVPLLKKKLQEKTKAQDTQKEPTIKITYRAAMKTDKNSLQES